MSIMNDVPPQANTVAPIPLGDDLDAKWRALVICLKRVADKHPRAAFASSLAAEDMVITHAILAHGIALAIFTLDTGRLHAETLALLDSISQKYGTTVEVWRPDAETLRHHVQTHGTHAFYESVELRKACCDIRKVQPLRRALHERGAWITGQRRQQSTTRGTLSLEEYDTTFGLRKYNPLVDWSYDDVWQVIHALGIPYNPLHDQGYPSIGCEPCTRAIKPGEDLRAGRWWWESSQAKECGLHAGNLPPGARVTPVRSTH